MIAKTLYLFSVLFAVSAGAATLVVESPRDYQVFQRQTLAAGKIVVSGSVSADGDRVQARIAEGPWKNVALDAKTRSFRGELPAVAGGFYSCDVRVMASGRQVALTTVAHVGVGEVFVIAGQSNATNYGEVRQQTKSGMVVSFSGTEWAIANDPQPGVQDNSTKGSFIPAFGDALYAKFQVPIGVACVGHGSTSVRQWLKKGERVGAPPTMAKFVTPEGECDGRLYDGMLKRIRELGPGGFRALLWHQGESDANQQPGHQISGAEYRRMLEHVIVSSRADAGWNFPWFVAEASYHSPADTGSEEIRAAQRSLWRDGIALEGPDTDALQGELRQNGGKGVHFSGEGLAAHGRLWAERVVAYLDGVR